VILTEPTAPRQHNLTQNFPGEGTRLDRTATSSSGSGSSGCWASSVSCLLQLPSCCVDTWSVEMLALDLGHQFLEQQRLCGLPAADGVCSFDCFISYCVQADVSAAEALFDRLVSLGFRPYIDTKFFFVAR
jgi:hypothetical protein